MGLGPEIFDQEILGSEEVTNGDFSAWTGDDPDGWTVTETGDTTGRVTEHADGCRFIRTSGEAQILQTSFLVIGTLYKFVIVIDDASSDVNLKASYVDLYTTAGTKTFYHVATSTAYLLAAFNPCDTILNSISIKEVIAPNKSIPSVDPWPALAGSELITNGTFDANITGWLNGVGCTVSWDAGQIKVTNDGAAISWGYQTITTVVGQLYRIEGYHSGFAGRVVVGTFVGGTQYIDSGQIPDDTTLSGYFVAGVTTVYVSLGTNSASAGANRNYDNITVRPIQVSWTQYGTNTIEVDETNDYLKIGFVDNDKGAKLALSDISDLTADLTVGQRYVVSISGFYAADDAVDPEVAIYSNADAKLVSQTLTTSDVSYSLPFTATHATGDYIAFDNMSGSETVSVRNLSIRKPTQGGSAALGLHLTI